MGFFRRTAGFLRRHSATIFSIIAAGGTVATGVLAARERPKSDERIRKLKEEKPDAGKLEVIANGAVSYLPAITVGGLTIASIFTSNHLNKKQQAELAVMCAVAAERYSKFKQKVSERHGREEAEELAKEADALVQEDLARSCSWYHTKNFDRPDRKILFVYRGEEFERYEREVMDAEYHLNRNFTLRGEATVNEFRDFLGLEQYPQEDEDIGWCVEDGFYWIDFEYRLREDGTVEIVSTFPPYNYNEDSCTETGSY